VQKGSSKPSWTLHVNKLIINITHPGVRLSSNRTHHTRVAALDLATGTLDLVSTDTINAAKAIIAPLATPAAVQPVGLEVMAPALAHMLASGAHALALLALGRVVAVLTTPCGKACHNDACQSTHPAGQGPKQEAE
jgi:hypothetical protein